MSRISKYVKLDKNILMEYIYDDSNIKSEPYNILSNIRSGVKSFISANSSVTNNIQSNQLFKIDSISNRYGMVDTSRYSFLDISNYGASEPIRFDKVKIHVPINWTFGEYAGFYIRIYTHAKNDIVCELSNFFFDMTDISMEHLVNFTSPPMLFQEVLWGKSIDFEIPSLNNISNLIELNTAPKANSINYNISNGIGLSSTSPIFIDFSFIRHIDVINNVKTYLMSAPNVATLPQVPDYEKLGLMIEHSKNGDFFEIYGMYNGTLAGFAKFIDDSYYVGERYYVQYTITIYEQNIRGKSHTFVVYDNFNDVIEYRPIIKYSTTTAIIDVEMKLIDSVDGTHILRRASYGMLQDEVSKYSANLMKINLSNANKPKIYNIKSNINPSLVGVSNSHGIINIEGSARSHNESYPVDGFDINNGSVSNESINGSSNNSIGEVTVEKVNVPYPVMVDRFNVISRSDNTEIDDTGYYGYGKMQIVLYPFDNIVSFTIASGESSNFSPMDLTPFTEINLTIKSDTITTKFPIFLEGNNDLSQGIISFKIHQSKMGDIKRIYNEGINVFYITGSSNGSTSVIYSSLYKIYDDKVNVTALNSDIISSKSPLVMPVANLDKSKIETKDVIRKLK